MRTILGRGESDFSLFVREAIRDFRTTASVAPSSRHLAQRMLRPLPPRVRTVLELGAGTGAITAALLDRLPEDGALVALEINGRFVSHLGRRFSDPRLTVVHGGEGALRREVPRRGIRHFDAVVSSIAMGYLTEPERRSLFDGLASLLGPDPVVVQYQYIHGLQFKGGRLLPFDLGGFLAEYFESVERQVVWRNLPPAFVFACRAPRAHRRGRPPVASDRVCADEQT